MTKQQIQEVCEALVVIEVNCGDLVKDEIKAIEEKNHRVQVKLKTFK